MLQNTCLKILFGAKQRGLARLEETRFNDISGENNESALTAIEQEEDITSFQGSTRFTVSFHAFVARFNSKGYL